MLPLTRAAHQQRDHRQAAQSDQQPADEHPGEGPAIRPQRRRIARREQPALLRLDPGERCENLILQHAATAAADHGHRPALVAGLHGCNDLVQELDALRRQAAQPIHGVLLRRIVGRDHP
jgi:hypothetical protein